MDTGAYVGMYTVDYPRMATSGPTAEQQRATGGQGREPPMADAFRPGVRCSELHRLAVEAIRSDVEPTR